MTPRGGSAARQGFSLIEVVLVLAVLGVAASVVAVGLNRSGSSARQRAAVEGVLAALSSARLEAMKSQSRVRVELAPGEAAGTLRLARASEARWWHETGLAPSLGATELASTGESGGVRREPASRVVDERANVGRSAAVAVTFDSSGRADRAAWLLAEDTRKGVARPALAAIGSGKGEAAAGNEVFVPSVGGGVGRTLWIVRFDVVSGTPSAERVVQP